MLGSLLTRLCAALAAMLLIGWGYPANAVAQTPSDSTSLPPIVFGVGAVGATLLTNTDVRGIDVEAELDVPLPNGTLGYRLHGFSTYVANYGTPCRTCVTEAGSVSGASFGIVYLTDVQNRVGRTRISVGPALIPFGETDTKQLTNHLGVDLGFTRLVSVDSSSGYALSLEPVVFKADGRFLWFAMAGVSADFW